MKHIKDKLNFLNQFSFSETSKEKKIDIDCNKINKNIPGAANAESTINPI